MSDAAVARALGTAAVLLFFVPLVAPFVQGAALLHALAAARRGTIGRLTALWGAGGAVVGFALFLATQYLWIV